MRPLYLMLIGISLFIPFEDSLAQVNYEAEIQPIFDAHCTTCHGGRSGIFLTSYDALMGSDGDLWGDDLIVAGDPDASGLIDALEVDPERTRRMPQGQTPLTDSEINLIRRWISEGAMNIDATNTEEFINPEEFRLLGNYPNPFNPTTQIQFTIPVSTQYSIQIYSIHGELISEQTGNVSAGLAQVNLDMALNPSGVYIYRVTAIVNNSRLLIGSGRMTLIK